MVSWVGVESLLLINVLLSSESVGWIYEQVA